MVTDASEKYKLVDAFLENHPEYAANMVAIGHNGNVKKQIKLGEKFSLKLDAADESMKKQTASDVGFEIASDVSVDGRKFAKKNCGKARGYFNITFEIQEHRASVSEADYLS